MTYRGFKEEEIKITAGFIDEGAKLLIKITEEGLTLKAGLEKYKSEIAELRERVIALTSQFPVPKGPLNSE